MIHRDSDKVYMDNISRIECNLVVELGNEVDSKVCGMSSQSVAC